MSDIKFELLSEPYLNWARELHNDPEVLSMLNDPRVVSPEEQLIWFKKLEKSKTSERVLVKLEDTPIGLIRIDSKDYANKSVCLGLDIHKDFRGKGYAKPIYRRIMGDLFEIDEFNRIWLTVACYNKRAVKLYTDLGFVLEGIMFQTLYKNGEFYNSYLMAVTKKNWKEND